MSMLSTAFICCKGIEKREHCALYHYYNEVAPKRTIARSKLTTSFNDYQKSWLSATEGGGGGREATTPKRLLSPP